MPETKPKIPYEVVKVRLEGGEFVETHVIEAPPSSPWDALMLVTSDFANPDDPGFFGLHGHTPGDLRIASREGLHWWWVTWDA